MSNNYHPHLITHSSKKAKTPIKQNLNPNVRMKALTRLGLYFFPCFSFSPFNSSLSHSLKKETNQTVITHFQAFLKISIAYILLQLEAKVFRPILWQDIVQIRDFKELLCSNTQKRVQPPLCKNKNKNNQLMTPFKTRNQKVVISFYQKNIEENKLAFALGFGLSFLSLFISIIITREVIQVRLDQINSNVVSYLNSIK